MAQLILSPNSTSIYAALNGLGEANYPRVVQFFLDNVNTTPKAEILVPASSVQSSYTKALTGLKTNTEYTVIVRVIDDRTTEIVLEEYTEKATCGGGSKDPSFTISEIATNSAKVELYRGTPSYDYYRLYVFDTVDEEAVFTDWLKPDSYPKQLTGLESGRLYKVNVGYGDIYGGGVSWIGTQTFTTITEFDTGHSDEGSFVMPDEEIPRNIIGTKAGSLKTSSFNNVYTRVTVTTKDNESSSDIAYSVGNDDGLEMEVSCPWIGADEHAAIKMATYILSVLNNYKYFPYTSSDTLLDPAAELGDLISFDTVTSEIISLDINYERIMSSEVSAPTSNETEHEFPQGATSKDSTKRYVDGVRAALELEIDKITALVENNEGRFQKLQVTLDGVIIQNEEGQTIINGAHIQTGTIVFNQISGMNSWKDSVDGGISNANIRMDGIDDEIEILARNISQKTSYSWSRVYNDLVANGAMTVAGGVTMIENAMIYSPEIYAGELSSDPTGGIQLSSDGLAFTLNTINGTTVSSSNLVSLTTENASHSGNNFKLPSVLLGQGTGTTANPAGSLKKYTNGIWIGEYFSDSDSTFSPIHASNMVGLFVDFAGDGIVLNNASWGPRSARPSASNAMEGMIYIQTD